MGTDDPAIETVAERDQRETVDEHDERERDVLVETDAALELLRNATGEVAGLRSDINDERKSRRLQVAVLALSFAFNLVLSVALFDYFHDRERERCEQSNDARADLRDAFTILVEAATASEEQTPEGRARADAFLADITGNFPARDC